MVNLRLRLEKERKGVEKKKKRKAPNRGGDFVGRGEEATRSHSGLRDP